ncbi:hypothetical protein GCM10023162_16360 [Klenkia terrae]
MPVITAAARMPPDRCAEADQRASQARRSSSRLPTAVASSWMLALVKEKISTDTSSDAT